MKLEKCKAKVTRLNSSMYETYTSTYYTQTVRCPEEIIKKKISKPYKIFFIVVFLLSTVFIVWAGLGRDMPLSNTLSAVSLLLILSRSPQVLPNRRSELEKCVIRNIFF